MRYRVEAIGVEGSVYVYEVEAPTQREAVQQVYGTHGRMLRDGLVQDWLGPFNTVEEIL